MFRKTMIVAAGVTGYVLGTKAGRGRYEQIRSRAHQAWQATGARQEGARRG